MEHFIKAVQSLRNALLELGLHPIDVDQIQISIPFDGFEHLKHQMGYHTETADPTRGFDHVMYCCDVMIKRKPLAMSPFDSHSHKFINE